MADRERLELLCSRFFDGELTKSEKSLLEDALKRDPALKAIFDDIEGAHNNMARLADSNRLPAGFTSRIIGALPADAPMIQIGWRTIVVAAGIVLALGLIVIVSLVTRPEGRSGSLQSVADTPAQPAPKPDVYTGPSAEVTAYSASDVGFETSQGSTRQQRFEGTLALPAVVSAPPDTHAVVRTAGGTLVLSPGSKARLTNVDADGVADFEPIDGDLYIESNQGAVHSRVENLDLSIDGGVTLRRKGSAYLAEPSHGASMIDGQTIRFRQCAMISDGGVTLEDCDESHLDDWAIDGRADAILREVESLLGEQFEQIPHQAWEHSRKMLRGILSRPSQSATHAYALRFLLRHGFFEDSTPEEIQAWSTIADILAEGTTESDIPVQVMEMFQNFEAELKRNPDAVRELKQLLRNYLERINETQNSDARQD